MDKRIEGDIKIKQQYGVKRARNKYAVSDEIKQHRDDTPIRMVELVDKYASDEFVVIDETLSEHAFAYDPDTDTIRI